MHTTLNKVEFPSVFSPDDMAELEAAIADLINNVRDPVKAEQTARELDEGREEIRRRLGEVEMAVELIREVRDDS